MAGSFSHIVNDDLSFRGVDLLDDLGDAYEALEECYNMILVLADNDPQRIQEAYLAHIEKCGGNSQYAKDNPSAWTKAQLRWDESTPFTKDQWDWLERSEER